MIKKDEWLSQYFPKGAYNYSYPFVDDVPVGFTYSKVLADQIDQVNLLNQDGFSIVEVLIQLEQKQPAKRPSANFLVLEKARLEDRKEVMGIARQAFTFSRFYQDHNISKETANQIKADWVSNYFDGKRGDNLIVARREGKVVGFLLLISKSIIDLIAVSPSHQHQGVGAALIHYANEIVGLLKAGTQVINKPSLSLYEKAGFFIKNANIVLHKHVKPL
jgi:GNAT superfamily N-acetyltransferase